MNIVLNGETHALPDHSRVTDLIAQLGLVGQRLAIELNGDIAPRSQHAELELKEGDAVEIVRAIGGG
ncbi:MAG TPA: sulfur carrier protein ThiS [bacterium]|nr:sulfur carrier protein ThiS [bacterium]